MKLITEKERQDKIALLCDDEFLIKLTEVAKLYGWHGDYVEIAEFVSNLYIARDKEVPNLDEYEIKEP